MLENKRILISPLDWGLGHATRCIPIIQLLKKENAEVIIAGDGRSLELLKKEFPKNEFLLLPGYNIQYAHGSLALKLFLSTPKIFNAIKREHHFLKKVIAEKNIDLVISDNRYGLWNDSIPCIFITHQLSIKSPIAERLLYRINHHYIKKFNQCWVPDYEDENNLSGLLSHSYPKQNNVSFVGILSRFQCNDNSTTQKTIPLKPSYDVVIILSGPEPQRSVFENIILEQAAQTPLQFLIVQGITEKEQLLTQNKNVDKVTHLNATDMKRAISSAAIILARSGYSTIMDMAVLKKKVVFVPTPGQTEQEYLAKRCKEEGIAYFETQAAFSLQRALEIGSQYSGFGNEQYNKPAKTITSLLKELV